MQLNMYQQQFGGADLALTEDQTESLLNFMKEEKKDLPAAGHPVAGMGQDAANMEAILSQDRGESLVQSQEYMNERVLERAKTVLSPTQLEAFAKFQTNQIQTLRVGMSMVRKFIAPNTQDAPANPGTP